MVLLVCRADAIWSLCRNSKIRISVHLLHWEAMGNNTSHASVPRDGYLAVRASIEARYNKPAACLLSPASPGVNSGTIGGGPQASGTREEFRGKVSRDKGRPSSVMLIEQKGALPPTLSVAETTDSSDGAPDEFETAASAEVMLGGLLQSFTRVRAPQVRAQSPLPFPSMATCAPTISRTAGASHEQQQDNSKSVIETQTPNPSSSGVVSPCSSRKPQELDAGDVTRAQEEPKPRKPDGGTSGIIIEQTNESDMFCPLSPNSVLDSATPTTVSGKVTSSIRQVTPRRGVRQDLCRQELPGKSVSYGPPCNHSPFLQGRVLRTLLPFLFGPSLGACMGVCVHWFMKISE